MENGRLFTPNPNTGKQDIYEFHRLHAASRQNSASPRSLSLGAGNLCAAGAQVSQIVPTMAPLIDDFVGTISDSDEEIFEESPVANGAKRKREIPESQSAIKKLKKSPVSVCGMSHRVRDRLRI